MMQIFWVLIALAVVVVTLWLWPDAMVEVVRFIGAFVLLSLGVFVVVFLVTGGR